MPYTMTVNGRELPLNDEEQSCACKLQCFGCLCCLCTLCLSWIPLCCYCSKMDKKYSGDQVFAASGTGMDLPKATDDNVVPASDAQVAVVPAPGTAALAME